MNLLLKYSVKQFLERHKKKVINIQVLEETVIAEFTSENEISIKKLHETMMDELKNTDENQDAKVCIYYCGYNTYTLKITIKNK